MNIGRGKMTAGAICGVMMLSAAGVAWSQPPADTQQEQTEVADGTLTRTARQATSQFQDPESALGAGYALTSGCVSGPEEGAMGVHYANAALVGDGALDATRPEVLVYEPQRGQLRLVAVEYIVIAEQWHASNEHPPILQGQHFHYVPAPNRTGLPAHYELHVWAWKRNPHGTFTDWNPRVSCDSYVPPAPAPTTGSSPQ